MDCPWRDLSRRRQGKKQVSAATKANSYCSRYYVSCGCAAVSCSRLRCSGEVTTQHGYDVYHHGLVTSGTSIFNENHWLLGGNTVWGPRHSALEWRGLNTGKQIRPREHIVLRQLVITGAGPILLLRMMEDSLLTLDSHPISRKHLSPYCYLGRATFCPNPEVSVRRAISNLSLSQASAYSSTLSDAAQSPPNWVACKAACRVACRVA